MSFAPKTESAALSPSTPDRRSTWEEAEALPFPLGPFRLAPKWISDRFNDHWSNGKTTGQAYCSVVGLICHGPIQHLRAIYAGGALVALPFLTRPTDPGDPDYYYVTIEFGGVDADLGVSNRLRLYWGDEDQPADTWLATVSGQDHPPYPGQSYVIFERLHCGQVQANSQASPALPNLEFLGVRLPSPSMPAALRLPDTILGGVGMLRGVNLVSAMWDILTHPRAGAGFSSSALDEADWIAKAEALEDGTKPAAGLYGVDAYVAPLLTGASETEKVVLDALSYIDGWLYTVGGKIRIDWYPNDGSSPGSLPEISEHDMVEVPEIHTASLAEAPTLVVVECLDGDREPHDLRQAVETAPVPFVFQITGEDSTLKLQRPWFTSRDTAARYGARVAANATIPAMHGSVRVRLHRAVRLDDTPLRVGDRFTFNYGPQSILTTARIIERLEDETTATLRWERERGVSSQPYVPAADPRAPYELPDPPTPGTGDWTVIEAPSGLSEDAAAIVLARRPTDALAGARVYLDEDNDWSSGSTLLGTQGFAAQVTLDTTIVSGDTACVLDGTDPDVSPFLGSGVTNTEKSDDTLVMLMGSEWLSIGAVSSAGAGSYNAAIARGRLGSTAAGHTAGAVGWIIRRDRIVLWRNAVFTQLANRYFKIAYYHALADGPLSAAKTLTFADRKPGPVTSLTATGLPGAIKLEWVPPGDSDLAGYQIYESTTTTQPADPSLYIAHPAISFTRDNLPGAATRYYWVRPFDQAVPPNFGNVAGSVNATTTSATAGADAYSFSLTMESPQVRCDSAGTALSGELGSSGRVNTTFSVKKGATALTATASTPGAGQFRVLKVSDNSCTSTFASGNYIELATVSADSGSVSYKIELEGTSVFFLREWAWVKSKAGTNGSNGTDGYTYSLTMESPQVRCDSAGTALSGELGSSGRVNTTFSVKKGATALTATASTPGAGQFRVLKVSDNSCTSTFAGGNYIELATVSADSGSVSYKIELEGTSNFFSRDWSWVKTKAGATGTPGVDGDDGFSAAFVTIYKRSATASPTLPSATTTFTFATGALSGLNNGWTQAIPAGDGNPLYASSAVASGTGATDTIAAGEWPTAAKILEAGLTYPGTSTTSLALGTGSKTLTTQGGLAWTPGNTLRLIYTTDPNQWMEGLVTAYNFSSGSLTFIPTIYVGSGTYAAWTLALAGQSGTGATPEGIYVAGTAYYCNSARTSIVFVGTNAYRALNPAKDGLTTWGTPGSSSDWSAPDATYRFVASDIALVRDQTITKTLIMGDGTAGAGIIRWHTATAFMTGNGIWEGYDGSTIKWRVGNPSAYYIAYDGTDFVQNVKRVIIGDSGGNNDGVGELQVFGEGSFRKHGSGAQNVGLTGTVAQGTIGSPSATASASFAALRMRGYDGSAYVTAASIRLKAQATWSSGNNPTEMEFIVSSGSANNYLYLNKDGEMEWGGSAGTRDNAKIKRGGTNLLECPGTFKAGAFQSTYFESGITTASDFKDGNVRGYSGATQTWRIDYSTGRFYINNTPVLNSQYGSTPTDNATIIACLQHHGLCP